MKSRQRKLSAVRMFEQAVRIATRVGELGVSGMTSGRLEVNLRSHASHLRRLAENDPDNVFWIILQKAVLKLVKYVRARCC